ncbi:MAG TPA: hypothetical protein VHV54_18310 [Candidatus Binatia bacterium]|nr:hypothetical protein [Candidatus Binatia bacterium]
MMLISKQRIVIRMYGGRGMDYESKLPAGVSEQRFFKRVNAVFPTVTNNGFDLLRHSPFALT